MSLNKNKIFFYFFIFLSATGVAQKRLSDSVDNKLDEVIITATRTLRQLASLPLPAQIVSKNEIKKINSVRLSDLLSEQTGLILVQDHGEGVQMQGLDADYTLIMIDGVPLIGRTAGTLDLNRITVGNIEQIEIVKGASSSLYGSEAIAGVINIITSAAKEGINGEIGLRTGSFNANNMNANLSYKKDKLSVTVFANRYNNDGYDLDKSTDIKTVDPYHNYTFTSNLKYNFSKQTTLIASGRLFTETQATIPTKKLEGENNVHEWNSTIKLNHKHNSKWLSFVEFYATKYKANSYLNNLNGTQYSASDFNQLLVRPEVRLSYTPSTKHNFIGGVGLTHESLERTYFSNKPTFSAPYIYAQYDSHPTEKLNLVLGARFDKHNKYKSQFSPKLAARYKLNKTFAVKSSVGYGFKAPDFRQLYLDFTNPTVGYTVIGYNQVAKVIPELEKQGEILNVIIPVSAFNDRLNPESSISINAGVLVKPLNQLTLDINAFRNDIKDLIDTRVIANKKNGQNVFSYRNVSKVYTQGLEFNTTWSPSNTLKLSGGYQLLYAFDKDAEKAFNNGEVFARDPETLETFQLKKQDYFGLYNRSRHTANAKVFYTFKKIAMNTNLRATYRSKYGIRDSNNNNYLDRYDAFVKGYTIVDFAINKTLFKNYTVGFGIDNVLNFTDRQNISSISGRLIYGKLNIQI